MCHPQETFRACAGAGRDVAGDEILSIARPSPKAGRGAPQHLLRVFRGEENQRSRCLRKLLQRATHRLSSRGAPSWEFLSTGGPQSRVGFRWANLWPSFCSFAFQLEIFSIIRCARRRFGRCSHDEGWAFSIGRAAVIGPARVPFVGAFERRTSG